MIYFYFKALVRGRGKGKGERGKLIFCCLDLKFLSTSDRTNFQGRYVIRHPFKGDLSCEAGKRYLWSLKRRQANEAKTLANLTGWNLIDIRDRLKLADAEPVQWWDNLWNRQ